MLLRSSGAIFPNLFLVTLGATCRYAVVSRDGSYTLSDPGCSAHIPALVARLESLGLPLAKLSRVIITHPHADRIGGLPLLRAKYPQLRVCGTPGLHEFLKRSENLASLRDEDQSLCATFGARIETDRISEGDFLQGFAVNEIRGDNDIIPIDENTSLRLRITQGHTPLSCAFLVAPHHFLFGDQTFGYYRGAQLAAPGADFDLNAAGVAVTQVCNSELVGIGFPYAGAIIGDLVRKHLDQLMLNTTDLANEVRQALRDGLTQEGVLQQVQNAFYSEPSGDPCLQRALADSCKAVWQQLLMQSECR